MSGRAPRRKKQAAPGMPALRVQLVRAPGAPTRPSRQAFQKLFCVAWQAVPAAHRPQTGGRPLAVDLHVLDDDQIATLNAAHMRHAGPTDVLSFPLGDFDPERRAIMLGEIVVSFETAAREAAARKLPPGEELARYAVHGFLHLLGYEDGTPAQRRAMARVQEAVLKLGLKPGVARP